jgi:hypothetical protein
VNAELYGRKADPASRGCNFAENDIKAMHASLLAARMALGCAAPSVDAIRNDR